MRWNWGWRSTISFGYTITLILLSSFFISCLLTQYAIDLTSSLADQGTWANYFSVYRGHNEKISLKNDLWFYLETITITLALLIT